MVAFITRTDVHLGDRAPESRIDNWTEVILEKLEQVGKIALEEQADGVLDNGDMFNIKSPSRNSHQLVQKVAKVHKEYPCPVYANVGNHDVKFGDISYLPEAPLGVLFESGVFHRCYDQWEHTISKEGISVRLVGIPYHGTSYDMDRFRRIKKGDEDYLVVMAHVLASLEGGSMFEGEDIVRYTDLLDLDPDCWVFGHWHKNQGIFQKNGKIILNLGSLSRGSLSQDDLNRIPVVGILRFTKDGIEASQRELRVAPAEEVFNVEGRVRMESRDSTMSAFVENFKHTLEMESSQSLPLIDLVRQMDVPDLVKERTIHFLESAIE